MRMLQLVTPPSLPMLRGCYQNDKRRQCGPAAMSTSSTCQKLKAPVPEGRDGNQVCTRPSDPRTEREVTWLLWSWEEEAGHAQSETCPVEDLPRREGCLGHWVTKAADQSAMCPMSLCFKNHGSRLAGHKWPQDQAGITLEEEGTTRAAALIPHPPLNPQRLETSLPFLSCSLYIF